MSFEKDNDCVGCPMGCIHCGRGDFTFVSCDGCDESGLDDEYFFEYNGQHYCPECFKKVLREDGRLVEVNPEHIGPCDDRECSYCDADIDDVETMYKVDGELVCVECLDDYLKDTYEGGEAKDLIEAKYGRPDWE